VRILTAMTRQRVTSSVPLQACPPPKTRMIFDEPSHASRLDVRPRSYWGRNVRRPASRRWLRLETWCIRIVSSPSPSKVGYVILGSNFYKGVHNSGTFFISWLDVGCAVKLSEVPTIIDVRNKGGNSSKFRRLELSVFK